MRRKMFCRMLLLVGITLFLCGLLAIVSLLLLLARGYLLEHLTPWLALGLFLIFVVMIPVAWGLSRRLVTTMLQPIQNLQSDASEANCPPELRPLVARIVALNTQVAEQLCDLKEQKERFQVLTENMREGLILTGATGEILSYNSAALHLLGTEAPPTRSVFDLTDSTAFRETVLHAAAGTHGETTIYTGDLACQLIANPVANGNLTNGAVLVLLDVTEREKRDALRREFTSNVSHELKTPLTSIYGIADMLASGLVKTEDIGGFASRIRNESARMIALIEDIIRLSRLDDESFSEERVFMNLYEVAMTVLKQLQPSAQEQGIRLTLTGSAASLCGVPVIVEEMLYNLCDNAIKYNQKNGSVSMTVQETAQSAIFVVTDTGIGIPQAERERIFERFYRVDKSHSRQIGGTGLGLSIVKHGAVFHNAKIELESQVGKGTTISLQFPRDVATLPAEI